MATVPGVLYIGDYHGNGGRTNAIIGSTGFPTYTLQYTLNPRLTLPLPAAADGLPLVPAPYFPWYDGTAGTDYTVAASPAPTATTISVNPSPGWAANTFQTRYVTLINHGGFGVPIQVPIASNTAQTITVASWPGGTPAPGSLFRTGRGKFIHYSPLLGGIAPSGAHYTTGYSESHGSSWQSGGNNGVGPDITWVRAFAERVWPNSPHFHAAKFLSGGSLGVDWTPFDALNNPLGVGLARVGLLAELPRIAAAATERGNVIRWDLVIIDISGEDIRTAYTAPTNYTMNLALLGSWLQSAAVLNNPAWFASGAPHFQIVNHHIGLWGTTSPSAAFILRGIHQAFARLPANRTALVDMSTAQFAQSSLTPLTPIANNPGGEGKYYTFADYVEQGERFADTYLRQLAGTPSTPGNGIPVYGIIGDSNAVGQIAAQWVQFLESQSLIGDEGGTVVDVGYIYDRSGPVLALYDPTSNANTSGTINGAAGPELGIFEMLAKLHPGGFVVVKRAANGATLQEVIAAYTGDSYGRWVKSAGEHYDEFLADIAGAEELCHTQLGKVPDFRGLFVPSLGQNDCALQVGDPSPSIGSGARVQAALAPFLEDLRADLTTRTSGKAFPVIWGLPLLNTPIGVQEEVVVVRAALQQLQANDAQVRVFEMNDTERDRSAGDGVHDTPESFLIRGRRSVAKLTEIALN